MISFELKGAPELAEAVARMQARATLAVSAAMYQEAEGIMTESKRLVPVDEGTLRNSGFVKQPTMKKYGRGRLMQTEEIVVEMGYGGAASGYAVYLHEGTGPAVGRAAFFPPVDVIREWVRRVMGVKSDELDSVAFLVARSIGRKGLRPRKFLEIPFKARASTMVPRLARRVRGMVERVG